jgi:O-antigen ligase
MLTAAALSGYLLFSVFGKNKNYSIKQLFILLTLFNTFGLISALASQNRLISILGETQRKNGFITYVSLSIIMLVASQYINLVNIKKFTSYVVFLSIILSIYGFLQHNGKDFVEWNNPYNSVIGTAGNPNFSSAIYAILCTYLFTYLINLDKNSRFIKKVFITFLISLVFLNIVNTGSRQGLLALTAGISVSLIIKSYQYRRAVGNFVTCVVIFISILSIFGMLKIGPLQNLLYKDSVSVRGFYWRTGFSMLKNNLLTGVGLDNYGSFFNLYRSVDYPIRYGFEVTSSNAHNVFIQQFATGGLFYGTIYLFLTIFILIAGIQSIRLASAENKGTVTILLASWITFQAQSLVSIDNIAISVLGWLLGGSIVGIYSRLRKDNQNISIVKTNSQTSDIKQIIFSYLMILIVFIFCSFLFRAESKMIEIRSTFNPSNSESNALFYDQAIEFLKLPFLDQNYVNQIAVNLTITGHADFAIQTLKKSLSATPNSLDTLSTISNIYESAKQPENALQYRLQLVKLNPWNAQNYLQLGKDYRDIGNFEKMDVMLNKIKSFAATTDIYSTAKTELVRP